MIRKYIEKIGDNKNIEDMEKLGDMLCDVLYKLKEYNKDDYDKYKNKLKGMAYNYEFDEEMALDIVKDMKPLGEHWNLETTTSVKDQYGVDINKYDFYVVMNSLANDYGEIISTDDVETYVRMTKAFVEDQDAKKHKVWKYFMTIPKKE